MIVLTANPLNVGDIAFALRSAPDRAERAEAEPPPEFARPATARQVHPPLRLRPSGQQFKGAVRVAERVQLGNRLTLVGDPDLQALGETFHRFFASDDPARPAPTRLASAADMLRRWGAPQVAPGDLVEAADRLHAFLEERFGGAARLREWPVHAAEDLQVISGRIDLLVDGGGDLTVIDHKSFPGSVELDDERLRAFGGQVELYARALRIGAGRDCAEYWIHQPIAGVMVRVELAAAEVA